VAAGGRLRGQRLFRRRVPVGRRRFIAQKEFHYANGIHVLVWSPDSRWLVSGNQDPSVHLWIPAEDQEFHMSGYDGKVRHLAFDRTSRWLATSGGKDACIWDCLGAGPEGREPQMFPHDAAVCAVAFQQQHGLLATASQDGALMLWTPGRPQPLHATVQLPTPATKTRVVARRPLPRDRLRARSRVRTEVRRVTTAALQLFSRLSNRTRKVRNMVRRDSRWRIWATGRFDAYLESGISLWDIAAAALSSSAPAANFGGSESRANTSTA